MAGEGLPNSSKAGALLRAWLTSHQRRPPPRSCLGRGAAEGQASPWPPSHCLPTRLLPEGVLGCQRPWLPTQTPSAFPALLLPPGLGALGLPSGAPGRGCSLPHYHSEVRVTRRTPFLEAPGPSVDMQSRCACSTPPRPSEAAPRRQCEVAAPPVAREGAAPYAVTCEPRRRNWHI